MFRNFHLCSFFLPPLFVKLSPVPPSLVMVQQFICRALVSTMLAGERFHSGVDPLVIDNILFPLKPSVTLITGKVPLATVDEVVPSQLMGIAEGVLANFALKLVGVMHQGSVTVPVLPTGKYHVTLCALDILRFLFMNHLHMFSEICL